MINTSSGGFVNNTSVLAQFGGGGYVAPVALSTRTQEYVLNPISDTYGVVGIPVPYSTVVLTTATGSANYTTDIDGRAEAFLPFNTPAVASSAQGTVPVTWYSTYGLAIMQLTIPPIVQSTVIAYMPVIEVIIPPPWYPTGSGTIGDIYTLKGTASGTFVKGTIETLTYLIEPRWLRDQYVFTPKYTYYNPDTGAFMDVWLESFPYDFDIPPPGGDTLEMHFTPHLFTEIQ